MEGIIIGIIIALAGLGGGTGIALSGGVHIEPKNETHVNTTTIQNVGQTTIVDKSIRGAYYTLTNVRDLQALLSSLEDWQKREAVFAYDWEWRRWVVQYPVPKVDGKTNVSSLFIMATNGKTVTNKTNY